MLLCFLLIASVFIPRSHADASVIFSDVGTTHRAQAEIYYLVEGEITSGTTATTFSPDEEVTRQEAAALIGRALGLNGERQDTNFSDVTSGSFASGYIKEMTDLKIINGYPDGSFKPYQTLTRGQMALLISRAFGYGAGSVSVAADQLIDRGISQGIADGTFGETHTIKRADFAVFLARGINEKFRTVDQAFSQTMYVNVNDLNLRTGPSTKYPAIGQLDTGAAVQYGYAIGDWNYIKAGDKTGFVHSAYVQLTKPGTVQPPPATSSPTDLTVIIDPGHGDHDPGGVGNGYQEKNVVLNIARHMNSYFEQSPITAKMTRNSDTFVSLGGRVQFAQQNKGDIFVSLHTNALNGSANGQETFYYAGTASNNPYVSDSRALAIYLQNRMMEAWSGLKNRGVNPFGYGNFYVLRENTMPAALVEMGFIDSDIDIKYIGSETERKRMGRALYIGVLDYFYHYEGRKDVLPLYADVNASVSKRLH